MSAHVFAHTIQSLLRSTCPFGPGGFVEVTLRLCGCICLKFYRATVCALNH